MTIVPSYKTICHVCTNGPSSGSLLNPNKCEALNISNKRSSISFDYYIGSHPILWSKKIKYLV